MTQYRINWTTTLNFISLYFSPFKFLDSREIGRSERIQALQNYSEVEKQIEEQEQAYRLKRREEKEKVQRRLEEKQEKKREKQRKCSLRFDNEWYADINTTMYICPFCIFF